MKLSSPQQQVWDSNIRFRTLVTGRRFGKTHLVIRELCKYARHRKKRSRKVWYVAPYYGQAKDIVWEPLKEELVNRNWITSSKNCNESLLTARLTNGNKITLKGANNADSLRGSGVDFMALDEFQDIKPEAWSEVLRPMLSDTGGHALFTATPKGFNWAYDLYCRGQEDHDSYQANWRSWTFTTLQGGNVSPEEIEEAKRDLDERTFRQEYLASFENYSGIVYYGFHHKESLLPFSSAFESFKEMPLHIGMDFNVSPMCATISIENKRYTISAESKFYTHVIDEIVIYSSNTHEMSEEIRSRYPHNPIYIYPDPACRQRRTSAGGNTDLKILQDSKYHFMPRLRSRHPLIRDRVNAMNSRLLTASGERRLFINPKCRQLIKCLTNQLYKEGTMIPNKETGFDHMNDALGYHIEYQHPITSEAEGKAFNPMG